MGICVAVVLSLCLLFWSITTPHTGILCFLAEFFVPLRLPKVTINTTASLEVQSVNYLELTPIQLQEMLPINVLDTEFGNVLLEVQAH